MKHLRSSPIGERPGLIMKSANLSRRKNFEASVKSPFIIRQYENLPNPLNSAEARDLLAALQPPFDLIARWQLYTGMRISEALQLNLGDIQTKSQRRSIKIEICRKGRKHGYIIAPAPLIRATENYIATHRLAWQNRTASRRNTLNPEALFITSHGKRASKGNYQRAIRETSISLGFRCTSHTLRATFACTLLSKLESLSKSGASINPLMIVKILMGHSNIETTDRYLRAIYTDGCDVEAILEDLLGKNNHATNPSIQEI